MPIEMRRPPGPRTRNPAGLLMPFSRDPLGMLVELARTHGDMVRFRLGPQVVYLVSHPELVREVLVTQQKRFEKAGALRRAKRFMGEGLLTAEGDRHARRRRLAMPAFHRQRLAAYADGMAARAGRMAGAWSSSEPVEVASEMMRLTLAVVAETLFGADLEAEAAEIEEAIEALLAVFPTLLWPLSDVLLRLPTPANRRAATAFGRLDATVRRLIAERRSGGDDQGDLLSMLLLAVDTERGGGLDDDEVRDEVMTLMLAGHETTANALSWCFWLIAAHPEVQSRLQEELDAVLAGRPASFADLPRLTYTDMVFAEALRLYPPGWAMGRLAKEPVELGGYRLDAGAMVLLSPFVVHRDERFFPDPERFDPERWRPEAKAERVPFAYFPFGAGPRGCIGEPFAWMEALCVIASVCQQRHLSPVDAAAPELDPRITLRPKGGLRLRAVPRQAP